MGGDREASDCSTIANLADYTVESAADPRTFSTDAKRVAVPVTGPVLLYQLHIALFTPGYPHVDAVLRSVELSRRHDATLTRVVGEPFSLHRDQFARNFIASPATHALLLEGEIVPPIDVVDRLLAADAPVATALYPQWADDRLVTNVQTGAAKTWADHAPATVFAVRRCLLGCVLVRRETFAAIQAPWFLSTITGTRFIPDDEWFCAAVRRAGLSIVCDGAATCSFIRQGTDLLAMMGARIHRSDG